MDTESEEARNRALETIRKLLASVEPGRFDRVLVLAGDRMKFWRVPITSDTLAAMAVGCELVNMVPLMGIEPVPGSPVQPQTLWALFLAEADKRRQRVREAAASQGF